MLNPRRSDQPVIRVNIGGKIWTNTHTTDLSPYGYLKFLYSTYGGGERLPYNELPIEDKP